MDCDAIRTPNFSAQVLRGLITSSIAFSVFDERFRFHFVNDALAKINRVPVKDHLGESVRKIAGDLALKAEPILESIFDTGKVVSGFEITGKLPKRPDVAHWVATYFPIRNEKRRIIQVGVLSAEIVSNGGIGKDHRIPLAELKCMSPKRVKELDLYLGLGLGRAARRRGEEPGRARPIESAHGRRPLFRPGP